MKVCTNTTFATVPNQNYTQGDIEYRNFFLRSVQTEKVELEGKAMVLVNPKLQDLPSHSGIMGVRCEYQRNLQERYRRDCYVVSLHYGSGFVNLHRENIECICSLLQQTMHRPLCHWYLVMVTRNYNL